MLRLGTSDDVTFLSSSTRFARFADGANGVVYEVGYVRHSNPEVAECLFLSLFLLKSMIGETSTRMIKSKGRFSIEQLAISFHFCLISSL